MTALLRTRAKLRLAAKLRNLVALIFSERGQSLVELALLTPILLVLVIGVVEMGRYASLAIQVSNAARAGTAYGSLNLANAANAAGIKAKVQADDSTIAVGNITVLQQCACDASGAATFGTCAPPPACTSGQHLVVAVNVSVTQTYNSLFHYPGIPTSLALTGNSIVRVSQ
jgi:Flp pilus assembly protein TadG